MSESVERLIDKINVNEIAKKGVQALADRPNSMTAQYGQGGLTAQGLKEWFDKLALEIVEKINAITGNLAGEGGAKYIPTNIANYISLSDLATAFSNGKFAFEILKLYGSSADEASGENIKSLQEIINYIAQQLSEHQEYIDNDAGWYAGEDFNSLGQNAEGEEITPQNGDLYLITGGSYTLGDVYQYDDKKGWQKVTNIRGAKGEKGDTSTDFHDYNGGENIKMFVGEIDEWKAYQGDKTNMLFIPTDDTTRADILEEVDERVATVETKVDEANSRANLAAIRASNAETKVDNAIAKTYDLYRHDILLTPNGYVTNNVTGDEYVTFYLYLSFYNADDTKYTSYDDVFGQNSACKATKPIPVSVNASVIQSGGAQAKYYGTLSLDIRGGYAYLGGYLVSEANDTSYLVHTKIYVNNLDVVDEVHKCN